MLESHYISSAVVDVTEKRHHGESAVVAIIYAFVFVFFLTLVLTIHFDTYTE